MHAQVKRGAAERTVTAASLHRIPLFRETPEEVLAPLAARSSGQVLSHGDLLWRPDDVIEVVVALARGVVRLYRYLDDSDDSAEVTVALLDAGQVCGLTDLSVAFVPTTAAQALSDETVVYRLPRQPFARFLLAHPDLALRVLAAAHERIRDGYDLRALPDAHARAAYVLAHLATANRERMVWATQEELAAWAGCRREALSAEVLPDLRGQGLITYERHPRPRPRGAPGAGAAPRRPCAPTHMIVRWRTTMCANAQTEVARVL